MIIIIVIKIVIVIVKAYYNAQAMLY